MKDKIIFNGNVKALIFDCDGTLVDSMPLHMKAWEHAFDQFEETYDKDFLFALKGMKETEIIDAYNKKFRTSIDPIKIVNTKHDYFIQHINEVQPIKPIVDIAESYYGNLPLAVVSGSIKDIVHSELKVVNILDLFDIILTADDPYKPKPDPDIFIAAAKGLRIEAEDCLVFEDGDPGLEAASKAGMKSIDIRNYIVN